MNGTKGTAPSTLLDQIRSRAPAVSGRVEDGWHRLTAPQDAWLQACRALKEAGCNYLASLTCVHRHEEEQIELVAHMMRIPDGSAIRPVDLKTQLKTILPDKVGSSVPSVAHVWPTAEWHEREAFDMFGVVFDGHPYLRRILMDEECEEHPLRKDFVDRKPNLGFSADQKNLTGEAGEHDA